MTPHVGGTDLNGTASGDPTDLRFDLGSIAHKGLVRPAYHFNNIITVITTINIIKTQMYITLVYTRTTSLS
eukprot:6209052-Pleurochrysis_carterae.AAC.7